MTNIKIRIIQVLMEAALPIVGFIFWKWSFFFILLFYILDFLAASVSTGFKIKKVNDFRQKKEKIAFFSLLFAFLINIGIFVVAYFLLLNLNSNFDITKETVNFVMLEDMGMPQGILLIPLVFYASYLNYKTQFLLPKKYEFLTVKRISKHYLKGITLAFLGFLLAFILTKFIAIPEMICVIILVLSFAFYSFFEKTKV